MSGPPEMGVPPPALQGVPRPGRPGGNETTMAMLCHLLALFTGFIGPLVIWLVERDRSRFVDAHGREVLNFMFTLVIVGFGLGVLLICSGLLAPFTGGLSMVAFCAVYLLVLVLAVFQIVVIILGCIEAGRGGFRPYPIRICFLRPVNPYGP